MRGAQTAVVVTPVKGTWHGPERHLEQHWRWSAGKSELRLTNTAGVPVQVALRGRANAVEGERRVRIAVGERLLWGEVLSGRAPVAFSCGLTLPPGETVVTFSTDRPAQRVGTDPRDLAFQISNLEIVVTPPGVRP